MTSDINPLTGKLLCVIFIIRCNSHNWRHAKSRKLELPEFRKVPEGFRKGYRKGCFGFLCSAAVPEGSGRFPEGLPEGCFKE